MAFPSFSRCLSVTLLVLACVGAWGAEPVSRQTFKTDDFVHWFGTNGRLVKTEHVDSSRLPREEVPADQDVAGAWGFPSEGLQVSIRFEKPRFASHESIVAVVLIRNVASAAVQMSFSLPEKAEFIIHDSQGQVIVRKDAFRPSAVKAGNLPITEGHIPLEVLPLTQRKYRAILSDMFDLALPGVYSVKTVRRVRRLDGSGWGEVMSGTATFTVLGFQTNSPIVPATNIAGPHPVEPAESSSLSAFAATAGHERTNLLPSTVIEVGRNEVEPMQPRQGSEKPSISPSTRAAILALVLLGGWLGFFFVRRARRTGVGGRSRTN